MSIKFGATFNEAVIHAWALRNLILNEGLSGVSLEIAEVQFEYVCEKLWNVYPTKCEEHFDQSGTEEFPVYLKIGVQLSED